MKFPRRVSEGTSGTILATIISRSQGNGARVFFTGCVLCALLVSAGVVSWSKPGSQTASAAKAGPANVPGQALTDAEMARMSSSELAHYVFEHHGCDGCHTLGANGKLGFTERGKLVGKGFEGCIAQLTAMSAIVQVKETDRTAEQKHKVARFEEFGCTTCHQVAPGKLGLTTYGTKLKSLHMACTDVEKTLATQKR